MITAVSMRVKLDRLKTMKQPCVWHKDKVKPKFRNKLQQSGSKYAGKLRGDESQLRSFQLRSFQCPNVYYHERGK